MKNKTLVYVEGLWATGKTHFVSTVKNLNDNSSLLIHDNAKDFGIVKWAQYEMFPLIFKNNDHLFDQSPVALKAAADTRIDIYNYKHVSPEYWSLFYYEWMKVLKNSKFDIIFLYFRLPSDNNGYKEVLTHVNSYSNLLVNPRKVSPKVIDSLNDLYLSSILEIFNDIKTRCRYYQLNYRDTEEAIRTLKYEKLLFS